MTEYDNDQILEVAKAISKLTFKEMMRLAGDLNTHIDVSTGSLDEFALAESLDTWAYGYAAMNAATAREEND